MVAYGCGQEATASSSTGEGTLAEDAGRKIPGPTDFKDDVGAPTDASNPRSGSPVRKLTFQHIQNRQRNAGPAYAVRTGSDSYLGTARNPRHSLGVEFASEGPYLRPGRRVETGEVSSAKEWRVGFQLAAIGREGELTSAADVTGTHVEGNRVTYTRGGSRREWYVNGPLGVEQGFEVEKRRGSSSSPLVLEVAVRGQLQPEMRGENAVALENQKGEGQLYYSNLHVRDDRGERVPANLEVRRGRIALAVDDRDATYPLTVDPLVSRQEQKLTASDAADEDNFGWSVAIEGDTAVVGAQTDHHSGKRDAGSAYVYTRSNGTWSQQQKLTASDAGREDRFGVSVAIDQSTIIVGAYGDTHSSQTEPGSAYVFTKGNSTWSEQQKLTPSNPSGYMDFGFGVAVDADTAVVGAESADYNGISGAGAVYVYTRNNGTWSEQQVVNAPDAATYDGFGESVAVFGDTLTAGAPADEHGGAKEAGSAYVFTRNSGAWSHQEKLTASDASPRANFGKSIAADQDTLLVGAHSDKASGRLNAGAAYIYERTNSSWTEKQKLVPSDSAEHDLFGTSVALEGDTAVIGARHDTQNGRTKAGSAYAFSLLSDIDGDGVAATQDDCPNDADKTEPGICGCQTPDTDTDGDRVPDCRDLCPTTPSGTTSIDAGAPNADASCPVDNGCPPGVRDGEPDEADTEPPGQSGCGCSASRQPGGLPAGLLFGLVVVLARCRRDRRGG